MADAEPLHGIGELLADGARAPGDDVPLFHIVLPAHLQGRLCRFLTSLGPSRIPHRVDRAVAGGLRERRVYPQHLLVEVFDVLGVVFLGLFIGFRYTHKLEEAEPVGIVVNAPFGDSVPVPLDHLLRSLVAEIAQVAVNVVPVQHPVPGFQAAAARDPDRGVGLLEGSGPDVHIAELGVFPVKREGFPL